jgi:hypothetical protein
MPQLLARKVRIAVLLAVYVVVTTPVLCGQQPAKSTPAMTVLLQTFERAASPSTADLIGTWVMVKHVMTLKFLTGRDGGEDVRADPAGVRREAVPGRPLEWTLSFFTDSADRLMVRSEAIGGPEGGGVALVARNATRDIVFRQDYGGDSDWVYRCRAPAPTQLACVLRTSQTEHGVEFLKGAAPPKGR